MTGIQLYTAAHALIAAIESPEGADTDSLDPMLAAWLEASDDKIAAYHAVLRRIDDEDAAMKAEQDAFIAARKRLAVQRDRVRELATALLSSRESLGEEAKIKRPTFSAWLAASESVMVPADATTLPAPYVRRVEVVSADKDAIKRAIKAGVEVQGCEIVTSRTVRFRAAGSAEVPQ